MENQQNLSSPCFSTDSVKGFFSFRNSFESSSDKWSPISIYSGKNFPLQWLILLFVISGKIWGWFWQSQNDGIKQISWSEHPWLWPGHSTHWCQQDTVGTTSCEERMFWKVYIQKETHGIGGKKQKTNLTFPMILEDEKVWTVESGQLLTQGCSESPTERRISSNPGINKGKELWGDSTLKLKRFNIGC